MFLFSQADVKAQLSDSRDVYTSLARTVSLVSHLRTGWVLVVKDDSMKFLARVVEKKLV